MIFDLFPTKDPSPSEGAVIIWLIVIGAFAVALFSPEPDLRWFGLIIGVATMIGRLVLTRFMN